MNEEKQHTIDHEENELCIHCKTKPAHPTWRCCGDTECVNRELEEYQKLRKALRKENDYRIRKIEIKVKDDYILVMPLVNAILSNIDDITIVLNEMDEYKLVEVSDKTASLLVIMKDFTVLEKRVDLLEFDELTDAFLKGKLSTTDICQLYEISKKIRSFLKTKDPENVIIEHAKEYDLLQTIPFKEWTPLNLLVHIWRFYDMQKREFHFFDDKFQELMKHVQTYLKCYQSTKTKWYHVIPEIKKRRHYTRIFEDDLIIINLEEKTLQIVTKHDASAYDIPLKLFREYCKFMIDCNKCQYFENEGWKGKNCSECTFNPAFKDNFLPFETEN